jgi:hypothetical protein
MRKKIINLLEFCASKTISMAQSHQSNGDDSMLLKIATTHHLFLLLPVVVARATAISETMKSVVIPNNYLPMSYPRYKFNSSVTVSANPEVLGDPNGLPWPGAEKAKCNGKFLAVMN